MADNPKVRLIVSDDKEPTIKVRPGMKIEMVEVSAEDSEGASQEMVLSTLCGYGSTYCVAVIQTN
ncbi:hypothetical protein [Dinoroseobacter sp. S76]|uniref:hypothetical protein n=1 Tax=Dinoroseobacter sp. S76 TaxID=3415124 RepID=UPI003C7E3920